MDSQSSRSFAASADFVPESERIAVFDNDGTLWSEKPVYFQLLFAIDRIKALHSYSVPCVVSWPIREANQDYIDWIEQETRG